MINHLSLLDAQESYDELVSTMASGVVGRGMYDAAVWLPVQREG
jgi:hypothetical protein